MYIYVKNLLTLTLYAITVGVFSTVLLYVGRKRDRIVKTIAVLHFLPAIYGILSFTVLSRTPSITRNFVFAASYTNEFYREMFMNALLYYPVGLSLTVLIGPWSILAAFILSSSIETWQYFAGTGFAQGTDLLMNTMGAAIGSIPWFAARWLKK